MSLSQFQRRRRFVPGAAILVAFALLLTLGSAWSEEPREAIEAGSLVLMVVGILGRMWCTLYIGGRKSAEIVRDGPHSMMRNPLYVFSSVAAAVVGAQTGSLERFPTGLNGRHRPSDTRFAAGRLRSAAALPVGHDATASLPPRALPRTRITSAPTIHSGRKTL